MGRRLGREKLPNGQPMTASGLEGWIIRLERKKKRNPARVALIEKLRLKLAVLNEEGSEASDSEKLFRVQAQEKGWKIFRRGWPDFACERDGEIVFVEVKRHDRDKLRPSQREMLDLLSGMGLKCYTWRPTSGFQRWDAATASPC